jgi:hypothetical protein
MKRGDWIGHMLKEMTEHHQAEAARRIGRVLQCAWRDANPSSSGSLDCIQVEVQPFNLQPPTLKLLQKLSAPAPHFKNRPAGFAGDLMDPVNPPLQPPPSKNRVWLDRNGLLVLVWIASREIRRPWVLPHESAASALDVPVPPREPHEEVNTRK